MLVTDAQRDIRRAYVGGGPGAFVSGLVWFVAAYAQHLQGTETAFGVLFVGGMAIFPVGKLVSRFLFRRDNESASNPLGMTALECTIAMIGGLFAAWLFLPFKPALVFPLAAIAVGTHYLVFKTVYGDRTYWLLAGILVGLGFAGIYAPQLVPDVTWPVGAVEIVFGILLAMRSIRAEGPGTR